jgi:hypothetical protein
MRIVSPPGWEAGLDAPPQQEGGRARRDNQFVDVVKLLAIAPEASIRSIIYDARKHSRDR